MIQFVGKSLLVSFHKKHFSLRRIILLLFLVSLGCKDVRSAENFLIGAGKADITDGADGQILQGFSDSTQRSNGIKDRLYARAFIIDRYQDQTTSQHCSIACYNPSDDNLVLIVIADMWSATERLKQGVLGEVTTRLASASTNSMDVKRFTNKINENNFMLAGTHTHAAPGGYSGFPLYEFATGGFDSHTFECMVNGIATAIINAFKTFQPGDLLFSQRNMGANNPGIQRSATAYNQNVDAGNFANDVDTWISSFTLRSMTGQTIGVLGSHPLHPVALGQDNKQISGDTHGQVSLAIEDVIGGIFAFANSNAGDVSPNTSPPNVIEGEENLLNIVNDYENTILNGNGHFTLSPANIQYQHTRVDMSSVTLADGRRTYEGALGLSFTAGSTEDGVSRVSFDLYGLTSISIEAELLPEGVTTQNENNYSFKSAAVRTAFNAVFSPPSYDQNFENGHSPKPILIATGKSDPPLMPNVVPIQIFRINQFAIVGFPGEPTTMAGRRLRRSIRQALGVSRVVIISYANEFSGYTTTNEEYQTQQYEGAQTLFGPHTLAAYQQEYLRLAYAMRSGNSVGPGPNADTESVRDVARVTIRNECSGDQTVKFYRKNDWLYWIAYDTVNAKAGRDTVWYIPQDLLGASDRDFQARIGSSTVRDVDPGDMVRLCDGSTISNGPYIPWNDHY